jgi:hypothetical protein
VHSLWDRLEGSKVAPKGNAKPKVKSRPKPPRRVAPTPADAAWSRVARTVGTTTRGGGSSASTGAGLAIVRAPKSGVRITRKPKPGSVDAIIAEGDAIAARAAAAARLTPEQEDLRRKLRAEYAGINPGGLLGGRLERVSSDADPLINFTEKVTQPFTTPATVTGSLIGGDIPNALKQLVSATYWGDQTFPSEALNKRGWLPGGAAGLLLGLGVDIAPSFMLPGLKTPGRARGSQAAREVSRGQRLPQNTRDRVPVEDRSANLPARPAAGPQRGARLAPNRGPDIIPNPNAPVVPLRPRPGGGASVAGRARSGSEVPRRGIEDLPYFPSRQVQRAVEKAEARRTDYADVTAPRPTPRQIALSGRQAGRAEAELAAVERATVGRIRGTKPALVGPQRAQIEARLPGGATRTGVRAPSLIGPRRGPDLQTPLSVGRTTAPRAAKPKDVPYSPVASASRAVDEAATAARALVTAANGAPSAAALTRAGIALANAKAAVASMPKSPGYGMGAGRAATYTRLVKAISRVVDLRQRAGGRPDPKVLVAAGRELEAATAAHRAAVSAVRSQTLSGRSRVRGLSQPKRKPPTKRQERVAAPSNGRSPLDTRPQTVLELRRSSTTPMEGGRALPRLRTKVNEKTGKMERLSEAGPTPKQIGKAGKRLEKAEAKLKRLERDLYPAPPKPGRRPEPTPRQTELHRDNFTNSREREWIDSNMEYEQAFREAIPSTPLGINVTMPFRYNGKGVTIPFTSVAAANKFRAAISNGPLGEAIMAYRTWLVSRYGPNEVVRQGAIAADDIVRRRSGQSARFVRDETKRSGLNEQELILASHYLEGTAKGVVPQKVRDYADKMANFTERNLDEFIQAGGKVKRFGTKLEGGLDRQYVLHLLPREEWDDFAVSTLAKRQMLYGKKPGFIQKREVLTIEDLKNAGFHPVERLDELTFARAMAHHRALAEMELTRSTARRFGKRVAEDSDIPDGWQRIPSQFVDTDIVVPKDVAQTLRNVIAARMALPGNKVSKKAQQLNQKWKEWALLTAGHDIRNQFGDSALIFQHTMNPIAPLLALTFGTKALTGKGRVGGKSNLTTAEARRLAETGGMKDTGLLGGDVLTDVTAVEAQGKGAVKLGNPLKRPTKSVLSGVRTGRTYREGANKAGIFTRELRKGEGAVHATRVAKETIYDYADVGKAVHWARRSPVGAPFATWTAKNLPAQIRLAAGRPGQLSAALTGIESLRKQTGGFPRFTMPDWLRDRTPVPIPGYGNVSVDLPISSLNLIPTGSLGGGGTFTDTVRAWQSQLGPLMQLPIAATGNDPLTGEKFRGQKPASRLEQMLQQFPVTAFFLGGPDKMLQRDKDGEQVIGPASKDDLLSWIFRQFTPGLSTAGKLAGSEGRTFLDTARGPLLGHNLSKFFDPVKLESQNRRLAYEYRERRGDFNRRLKALAPGWKNGDPIPKQLRNDYNRILRIVAQGEWITEALKQSRAGRR